MNKTLLIALAVAPLIADAARITTEDAGKAASSWIAERHAIDRDDGSPVSRVVPVEVGGSVAYYRAERESGGSIILSADTGVDPVKAVIPPSTDCRCGVLYDILCTDSTNDLARAVKVVRSAKSMSPAEARWAELLGRSGVRKTLKAGTPGSPSVYVIPGFERGGAYTHWNQTFVDVKYLRGATSRKFRMYNYYMRHRNYGGPELGLPFTIRTTTQNFIPCGCVATAWSAAFQCIGVTGAVKRACYCSGPIYAVYNGNPGESWGGVDWSNGSVNTHSVPGVYDWSMLPAEMGGSSDTRFIDENSEVRELIGRVTLNCGLAVEMQYGRDGSGAFPGVMVRNGFGDAGIFSGLSSGWSFPGKVSGSSISYADEESVDAFIRSGYPAVASIPVQLPSTPPQGHCVLHVGRDRDTGLTYTFYGWGDSSYDYWYSYSDWTVTLYCGYDRNGVPLYGRVVDENGSPSSSLVEVYANGELVKFFKPDADGYFRGFYPAPSGNPLSFTEEVASFGGSKTTRTRTLGNYSSPPGSSLLRLRTADVGVITSDAAPVPFGLTFYSSDGDLSQAIQASHVTGKPLIVMGGDLGTNSTLAVDYVTGEKVGPVADALSCYTVSDKLLKGEYLVLAPSAYGLEDPYVRSRATLGYGASSSPDDVRKTIYDAVSGYRK